MPDIQKLRPSFTFTEDRLRELQQVVPEAFADGKINWDTLREALGEYLEDEMQEHFGLFWPGKREARRLAAWPPKGTLIPVPGEGVNEETTRHIFIEGENLEVLKLLQKSYAGRVKMIYIDPPYNTGNDFVYPDDYSEPLEAYLKRTGQMDEEGRRLTTNTKASGRFHSNWLNMMYPRLLLARQLLREDGVILVSIDDNEVHNLRQVLGEIFGEENFVAAICWEKADSPKMDSEFFSVKHDYILCFAKDITAFEIHRLMYGEENIPSHYNRVDENGRKYYLKPLRAMGGQDTKEDRPNLYYPITAPDGLKIYPKLQDGRDGRWRWSREKLEKNIARIEWTNNNGTWTPYFRIYADESKGKPPETMLFSQDVGSNRNAMAEIKSLFDGAKFFDTPKPVRLLKYFASISTNANDIILDFFAGSCTTAQAVLERNREDNGTRQFIMVQLPEPTPPDSAAYKAGYPTIADIGKERIRRVIAKMQAKREGQMDLHPDEDLGFKVFRLERSHFKDWQPVEPTEPQKLDDLFAQHASPLRDGWTQETLLTEILLLEGFPLDSQIIPLAEAFPENAVWRVHHPDVAHDLFICLDKSLAETTVEKLKTGALLRGEDIFICLDAALTDEAKVTLDDRLRLKVI